MSIALSAKNKLAFITGKVVQPDVDSDSFSKWQRCNDMVTLWILNGLSSEIAESVIYSNSAYDIWKDLEERFGQANGSKLYELQKEICSSGQGSLNMAGYFTKMKNVWDELNVLSVLPSCTCGAAKAMVKFDQDQILIQFLMGLNSYYSAIRGQILMMQPLPTIGQAYSFLVQDEKQREIHASSQFLTDSVSVNASSSRGHFQGQSQGGHIGGSDERKSVICSNCKKPGHPASKCYRLIGFPKDFKFTKFKRITANVYGDQCNQEEESEEFA